MPIVRNVGQAADASEVSESFGVASLESAPVLIFVGDLVPRHALLFLVGDVSLLGVPGNQKRPSTESGLLNRSVSGGGTAPPRVVRLSLDPIYTFILHPHPFIGKRLQVPNGPVLVC